MSRTLEPLTSRLGKNLIFVQVTCSSSRATGELPAIEPLEEVLAVSVFDSPESALERDAEDFDEREDSNDETLELPKFEKLTRPPIELKTLPSRLRYVFLNSDVESPVIISDKLLEEEMNKLIAVLEKHRSVLGYTLQDLKGISPALCTHRIPLDPEIAPSREPQRRLNNAMREVVKKEVLKLIDA